MSQKTRLVVVGDVSGTHLAGSFSRAAEAMEVPVAVQEIKMAESRHRLVNSLFWHLCDKRPVHVKKLGQALLDTVAKHQATLVLTTGLAPILPGVLQALRERGVQTMHYATDDPWNPVMGARWYFIALQNYDVVFSPRRSTMDQLANLPCRAVRYLPFGYDHDLFPDEIEPDHNGPAPELLFIGGADDERAGLIRELVALGVTPTLAGGYWDRYDDLSGFSLGNLSPKAMRSVTRAAKTNLCLVRRANRDGHVMRSYEIGALGACALVEDTSEHRAIFGEDGDCVRYFTTPNAAAVLVKHLLSHPDEAKLLGKNIRTRIRKGHNTYRDRLQEMLTTIYALSPLDGGQR